MALVLGMNEGVFPATPSSARLLTETEREALTREGFLFGRNTRELLGRERFFGYIACTRARERLVLTCSERDVQDDTLNPSPFFALGAEKSCFRGCLRKNSQAASWEQAEHACELSSILVTAPEATRVQPLFQLPAFESLQKQLKFFAANEQIEETCPRALLKRFMGRRCGRR